MVSDLLLKSDGVSESSDIKHEDSIHSGFIKNAMPDWLVKSSDRRVGDLRNIPKFVPEWSKGATPAAHLTAKEATQASWQAQNQVDRMLGKLEDVESFAQPLLTRALKEQYNVELDVRETFLRLYSPAKTSGWSLNVLGGVSFRTVSLLSAALHNFAEGEILTADSAFISKPDANGHFEIKKLVVTVEQFKALCRTLDIGARYKKYLESYVTPADAMVKAVVQHRIVASRRQQPIWR